MVQADISQLSRECNTWRDALRAFRDEFTQCKQRLQQLAGRPLSKDDLTEVEHYHNQFHIQLINIHDLKQQIKFHEKRASLQNVTTDSRTYDQIVSDHERLYEEYTSLDHMLQDLKNDFHYFVEHTQ